MGRALRAWIWQKQWKNVFTILALIALWNIFAAYAQDDTDSPLYAELRSGNAGWRYDYIFICVIYKSYASYANAVVTLLQHFLDATYPY